MREVENPSFQNKYITEIFNSFERYSVLITPPYIPAGMTGMRPESAGMQINSTGIQPESTGIGMNYLI